MRALRLALRRLGPKYARKSNKALRSACPSVCLCVCVAVSVCAAVLVRRLTSCFYTLSSGLSACGEAAYKGRMPELQVLKGKRRGKIGQRERSNALCHASDIHLLYVSLSLSLFFALFVARSINFIALLFFLCVVRVVTSLLRVRLSCQSIAACLMPRAWCGLCGMSPFAAHFAGAAFAVFMCTLDWIVKLAWDAASH